MSDVARTSVLVVDDEPVLAGTVKNYLERAGMAADTCADGNEAVSRIREEQPDVVILDLGLPGLDGVEVCRKVRTFSDCYVLMLTALPKRLKVLLITIMLNCLFYILLKIRWSDLVMNSFLHLPYMTMSMKIVVAMQNKPYLLC